MRRRRVWLAVLAVIVAGAALIAYVMKPSPRPSPTISDRRFASAAAALCREQIPPLRADPLRNRSEERNERQTAERVEDAANGLDALVDDLEELPVAANDRSEVDDWIEAWREYVASGRRYADAVRSEDASAFSAEADASRNSLRRVGRFARANRVDDCILR